MNLDDFFSEAESIEPIKHEPRFYYEIMVHVFYHHSTIELACNSAHQFAAIINLGAELPSPNKIINLIREKNEKVAIGLALSLFNHSVDFDFIRNFKIKLPYNHFNYDNVFCSLKTKNKYHVTLCIRKNQHPDCLIELEQKNGKNGETHTFYSYYQEYSKSLVRKYEFKMKDVWSEIV